MRIFAGAFKGRYLQTTTGPGLRPAMGKVREALFSILEAQGLSWEETLVLDLFAGSGSLGFEALSRGAQHVCFVEKAPYACKVLTKNATLLHVEEKVQINQIDALTFIRKPFLQAYNLIFIDPPYEQLNLQKCLHSLVSYAKPPIGSFINAEIEARQKLDPHDLHESLELITDRSYGQTRVLLWKTILP